ncbi:MAG: hypothetical protein PHT12_01515 [Patescibacteria group bacterium]|nr:hypothetical protein [Patescibacteria group bacterium]
MTDTPNPAVAPAKKIRVGWFSYSCCEDSTIVFTEILNDHWQDWKNLLEFVHARVLQTNNRWEPMDIAFIEGAIANDHHAEEVKKIRGLAKIVVAIGSCACTGMPSAQRNNFSEAQKKEIEFLVTRFKSFPKVQKLSEVIKVDAEVGGCPMDPKAFVAAATKLIAQIQAGN